MKIAIAGYGIEGKASFAYWNTPEHKLTIVDEQTELDDLPVGIPTIVGKDAFKKLSGFDMVVRTAGLPPRDITTDGKIWSATNEFFAQCPAPIIGVTGTKGKGTTASLIASILQAAGNTVHLVGNIGHAALEVLPAIEPDDIVVYELSSFQLWDIEKSPHIAVVLMIEPDHLDVHQDFDEYIQAKANIRRHQQSDDYCIYHPTNEWSLQIAKTNQTESRAARYAIADDTQVYIKENTFFIQDTPICSVSTLQMPGAHNQENACAAISAARHYTTDINAIERGLKQFTGLPHRLKFVDEVAGVKYYDDSIATTPGSSIAAIEAFSQPKVLILGGSSKGANFEELAVAARQHNVKRVIAIGEEADRIEEELSQAGVVVNNLGANLSMATIVHEASHFASEGDAVILSPACASFGMFKNYTDRGNQFITEVRKLASTP